MMLDTSSTMHESCAHVADEEETLKQQVDSVNERANQLQESASMLQDKVAQADRTIELQSKWVHRRASACLCIRFYRNLPVLVMYFFALLRA